MRGAQTHFGGPLASRAAALTQLRMRRVLIARRHRLPRNRACDCADPLNAHNGGSRGLPHGWPAPTTHKFQSSGEERTPARRARPPQGHPLLSASGHTKETRHARVEPRTAHAMHPRARGRQRGGAGAQPPVASCDTALVSEATSRLGLAQSSLLSIALMYALLDKRTDHLVACEHLLLQLSQVARGGVGQRAPRLF